MIETSEMVRLGGVMGSGDGFLAAGVPSFVDMTGRTERVRGGEGTSQRGYFPKPGNSRMETMEMK